MDWRILAYLLQGLIPPTTVWNYLEGALPVPVTGAVAFGMAPIPIAFGTRTQFVVPWPLLFCIALSLPSRGGYAFNWYDGFDPYSDRLAHLDSSFTVALLGLPVVLLLHRFSRMHCSIAMTAFFTVIFALAHGAIREVIELTVDRPVGTRLQYGLDDTMFDLIADGPGGLIGAAPSARLTEPSRSAGEGGSSVPSAPPSAARASAWSRRTCPRPEPEARSTRAPARESRGAGRGRGSRRRCAAAGPGSLTRSG